MLNIGDNTNILGNLFVSNRNGLNRKKINDLIIENSGNNYLKFADGTMICYLTTIMQDCPKYSTTNYPTFLPQTYVDTNFLCFAIKKYGGAYWANVFEKIYPTSTSSINIDAWTEGNNDAKDIQYNVFTIGRWK